MSLTQRELLLRQQALLEEELRRSKAAGEAIGKESEERFFAAFRDTDPDLPWWFYGVRKGTIADDNDGTDGFAATDVGEAPLQIKASGRWFERHKRLHPDSKSLIIVVSSKTPYPEIRGRTLKAVTKWRDARRSPDWRQKLIQGL